jgi:hypothetical protein
MPNPSKAIMTVIPALTQSAASRKRREILARSLALNLSLAVPILAPVRSEAETQAETEGATKPFPPDDALRAARRQGQGRFRWFGLTIYDAELLTAQPLRDDQWPQQTFGLRLTYARTLRGAEIAKSSLQEMEKLGIVPAAQRDAWLQRMTALFPDVNQGDAITGVNLPNRGVRFWRTDRPLGTVDDPAFARAFFSIWLDPKTTAPELRKSLFGA